MLAGGVVRMDLLIPNAMEHQELRGADGGMDGCPMAPAVTWREGISNFREPFRWKE